MSKAKKQKKSKAENLEEVQQIDLVNEETEEIENTDATEEVQEDTEPVLDKVKNKAKNINYSSRKTLFLGIMAVVLLIVTFGVQYVFTDVIKPTNDTEIVNWMFVTGDSDEIVKKSETFNQAEQNNLISKPIGDKYVRCIYNTPKGSGGKILKVKTEHSPIKILVDGEEIYNNGYGNTELVGNSYNEVTLPESSDSQRIEMYIYYALGFNLNASIVDNTDTSVFSINNIGDTFPILISFAIILAGLFLLIAIFAMMFRSKDIAKMFLISLTVIASGISLFVTELLSGTMIVTSQSGFGISSTFVSVSMCLIIVSINSLLKKKNRLPNILAIVAVVVTSLTYIPNMLLVKIGLIFSALLILGSGVLLVKEMSRKDNVAMECNSAIRLLAFYSILSYMFNAVAISTGIWSYSIVVTIISLTLAMATLYFSYMRNIANKNLRKYIDANKTFNNSLMFRAVSDIISQQNGMNSKDDYIKGICVRTLDFLEKSDILTDNKAVCCFAAKIEDGKPVEFFRSSNAKGSVDFNSVYEVLSIKDEQFSVGTSFFEIAIGKEEKYLIICDNTFVSDTSTIYSFVSSLYSSVNNTFENFVTHINNETNQENIFINLAALTEEKVSGGADHLNSVEKMTRILAKELGYGEKSEMIANAAKLHDIGKITVSSDILNKKGPLTQDERYEMMQHVISGYNILSDLKGEFFDIARHIVLEHHENYDGTGYMGKKGKDINQYARIVKVVDVFDALLSNRSYKEPWSIEKSLTYIVERSGTEFDPDIVNAFINCGAEIIAVKENERV